MSNNRTQRYKIWIGDKIEGYENFADIDYPSYLANRQMIIAAFEDDTRGFEVDASFEISKRFRNQGGTILIAREGDVQIEDFKVAGEENMDSWNGKFLFQSIEFGYKSVCRVNYESPSTRHVLCSRVVTSNGAYMISYNVKEVADTFHLYPRFMESIKETRTCAKVPTANTIPGAKDETIRPTVRHTTEVQTINIPTHRSTGGRTQRGGSSSGLGVGAAIGVAAEVGLGLAIDHAFDIGGTLIG